MALTRRINSNDVKDEEFFILLPTKSIEDICNRQNNQSTFKLFIYLCKWRQMFSTNSPLMFSSKDCCDFMGIKKKDTVNSSAWKDLIRLGYLEVIDKEKEIYNFKFSI